jgi:hypothetical protein
MRAVATRLENNHDDVVVSVSVWLWKDPSRTHAGTANGEPSLEDSVQADTEISDAEWEAIAYGFSRFLNFDQERTLRWLEEMAACNRG